MKLPSKKRGRPPAEDLDMVEVQIPADWVPDVLESKYGVVGHMYHTAEGYKPVPGIPAPVIPVRNGTALGNVSQSILDLINNSRTWFTAAEIREKLGIRSQQVGYSVNSLSAASLVDKHVVGRTHFYGRFGLKFAPSRGRLAEQKKTR